MTRTVNVESKRNNRREEALISQRRKRKVVIGMNGERVKRISYSLILNGGGEVEKRVLGTLNVFLILFFLSQAFSKQLL